MMTGRPRKASPEKYFIKEFTSFVDFDKRIVIRIDGNEVVVTTISGQKINFTPAKNGNWDRFVEAAAARKTLDKNLFFSKYIDYNRYWYRELFPKLDIAFIDENYVVEDSKDGQYKPESDTAIDYNKELKLGRDNNEDDFLVIATLAQYTLFLKYFGKLNEGEVNDFEADLFSYAMKCQTR